MKDRHTPNLFIAANDHRAQDVQRALDQTPERPPTGLEHPDTSHEAAESIEEAGNHRRRAARVVDWMDTLGKRGATDEEVDRHFGWGHATTTALMSTLRHKTTLLAFTGEYRTTAKGRRARVHCLARFMENTDAR